MRDIIAIHKHSLASVQKNVTVETLGIENLKSTAVVCASPQSTHCIRGKVSQPMIEHSFFLFTSSQSLGVLSVEHANLPLQIFIDALKFKQILHNLLSNAIKFSHPGQKVNLYYFSIFMLFAFLAPWIC